MYGDREISTEAAAHLAWVVITETSPVVSICGACKTEKVPTVVEYLDVLSSGSVRASLHETMIKRTSVKTPKVPLSGVEQPSCSAAV